MEYSLAYTIAFDLVEQLRPHCDRIEIAGSIRRKKAECRDIEIVAIPKPYETGLFENGIASVVNQWPKVKGELPCKYTQRLIAVKEEFGNSVSEPIKLDLFFAEPGNWGLIFALRTGSADYSHRVLASGWVARGYSSIGGYLHYLGKLIETPEEIDLFNRAGVAFVEPEHRNL